MPYKNPEKQRLAVRQSQRKRRAKVVSLAHDSGITKTLSNPAADPPAGQEDKTRLVSALDARECLSRLIVRLESEPGLDLVMRARATGYLVGIFLETLEKTSIEDRLRAIERRLEGQHDDTAEEA